MADVLELSECGLYVVGSSHQKLASPESLPIRKHYILNGDVHEELEAGDNMANVIHLWTLVRRLHLFFSGFSNLFQHFCNGYENQVTSQYS